MSKTQIKTQSMIFEVMQVDNACLEKGEIGIHFENCDGEVIFMVLKREEVEAAIRGKAKY